MNNHSKKHRLGIVDFELVDGGLCHLEALIVQYVNRFERNRRPCFASIPHIAAELRLSERSTKRYIRRLIELGFLYETDKGRGRYLHTTGAKKVSNGGKLAPMTSAKLAHEWCQIGPLPIKVPIKDLPIKETYKTLDKANIKTKAIYENVWDESRQTMVRRRVE